MIPFLSTNAAAGQQIGSVAAPASAAADNGASFADVFSLFAVANAEDAAGSELPDATAEDADLLIPQDDSIEAADNEGDAKAVDPSVEGTESPVALVAAAPETAPTTSVAVWAGNGDDVAKARTAIPVVGGAALADDTGPQADPKMQTQQRPEPGVMVASQTVLDSKPPQDVLAKLTVPSDGQRNGPSANTDMPVRAPIAARTPQAVPETVLPMAEKTIADAPKNPIALLAGDRGDVPTRRLEPAAAGLRSASKTEFVTKVTQRPTNETPGLVAALSAEPQSRGRMDIPVEGTPMMTLTERGASATNAQTGGQIANTPEAARQVAQQLAVAISTQSGQATEIALSPKELGRVRLSMVAVEGSITLAVVAERPETADLIRRHIDVLAQEFKALGYDDIAFSFSNDGQKEANENPDNQSLPSATADGDFVEASPSKPIATLQGGLDLRL